MTRRARPFTRSPRRHGTAGVAARAVRLPPVVRDQGIDGLPRIRVLLPHVDLDTATHVIGALEMRWLGMGSLVKEFEERIAAFLEVGDRKVICTNTGTAALHVALLAAGVGPGDEVITPSFNYVADHQAVRMTGAEVVMCDVREEDLGV